MEADDDGDGGGDEDGHGPGGQDDLGLDGVHDTQTPLTSDEGRQELERPAKTMQTRQFVGDDELEYGSEPAHQEHHRYQHQYQQHHYSYLSRRCGRHCCR